MGDKLRKIYIILAAVTGLIGLILIIVVGGALFSVDRSSDLSQSAKDTMYRTSVLTGTEDALPFWQREIEQGHLNVSDYVENQFTAHPYLLSGKDDSAFASDLACVAYNDAFKTDKIEEMLACGSRKYAIEKVLSDVDFSYAPVNGFSDPKGTRCGKVEIKSPLENEEGYAFGVRRIEGNMQVEGSEMRTDFFVDQSLRPGQIHVPQVSGQVDFTMEWDTSGEIPGNHDVVILLRTSDGRGNVLTGGKVNIPDFISLQNDTVVPSSIRMGAQEAWYALDAKDRDAYVNLIEASSDVAVTLYDRYGLEIGKNDLPKVDFETLRAKKQEADTQNSEEETEGTAENAFFVRVQRSENSAPSVGEITYVLVQSKEVGKTDETGYLAIVSDEGIVPTPRPTGAVSDDEKEKIVTCKDERGATVELTRASITFLPLNAYLTELSFFDDKHEPLPIYPEFDMNTFDYSLVGDSFSNVSLEYTAVEGFAAKVLMSNTSNMLSPGAIGDSVEIQQGDNKLTVQVSSLDGTYRTYTLYLLNGQDSEGFRSGTLSRFPASYADGLWLLHSLHPNYRFEAYQTGLTFEEVLDNEDHVDRSLISSTYNPDWVKPGSPVYDGKSWKAAKREVVAYFLDPRNFLTPDGIFQFEKLSFDETAHTPEGISAMVRNSFMDESEPDYVSILLKAGKDSGVSPYFLTSRILQEMGRNGESKLCHGTLDGYEGYFNFYNIGSTPNPSVKNGAQINGAKYAKYGSKPEDKKITPDEEALLLPWTTPEKAICGGALWIAKSYIEIGQNTLYFQKFDILDNEDGMYKHQYAQNIAMASNEGTRYYTAYASQDMLDGSFVFIIPVYEQMPQEYGLSL
ncbi:MAG: hypothetical protein J6Y58_02445 [Clostridiales bacterium]|nr:hypothetical protein [Clostridiales bacterium]